MVKKEKKLSGGEWVMIITGIIATILFAVAIIVSLIR